MFHFSIAVSCVVPSLEIVQGLKGLQDGQHAMLKTLEKVLGFMSRDMVITREEFMNSISTRVTEEVLEATKFTILNDNSEVPILDISILSDRAFDMGKWIEKYCYDAFKNHMVTYLKEVHDVNIFIGDRST